MRPLGLPCGGQTHRTWFAVPSPIQVFRALIVLAGKAAATTAARAAAAVETLGGAQPAVLVVIPPIVTAATAAISIWGEIIAAGHVEEGGSLHVKVVAEGDFVPKKAS